MPIQMKAGERPEPLSPYGAENQRTGAHQRPSRQGVTYEKAASGWQSVANRNRRTLNETDIKRKPLSVNGVALAPERRPYPTGRPISESAPLSFPGFMGPNSSPAVDRGRESAR